MAGIKRGTYFLFAVFAVVATLSCRVNAYFEPQNTPVGHYGKIVASSTDMIKDALTERVVFYSQTRNDLPLKLERDGLLVRYPDAVGTILICHGFMCDKYDAGFLRRLFPRGKYNIMSFDFRAHGDKKCNQTCTLGRDEAYDVIGAAHFLKNHPDLKGKPLFVYGFSMGAVASIEAQAKDPSLFSAMILDCPFDSAENIIKRGLEHLRISMFGYSFDMPGKSLLQRYAFHPHVQSFIKIILRTVANMDPRGVTLQVFPLNPAQTAAAISVPCLFIHCKEDKKVSIEAIKSVYNNTNSDYKVLWITNGRNHFDSYFYNPERYTENVRNFLDQAVNGSLCHTKLQLIVEDEDDATALLSDVIEPLTTKEG